MLSQSLSRYRNKAKKKKVTIYFLKSMALWRVLKSYGHCNVNDEVNDHFVDAVHAERRDDSGPFASEISYGSFPFKCVPDFRHLAALYKIKSKSIGKSAIPIFFSKLTFPHIFRLLLFILNLS